MNIVKITFLSVLSELAEEDGFWVEISENSTVIQLFSELSKTIGEKFNQRILTVSGDLNKYIILVINGKDIRALDGLDTIIQDKDEISFLPALAGG